MPKQVRYNDKDKMHKEDKVRRVITLIELKKNEVKQSLKHSQTPRGS